MPEKIDRFVYVLDRERLSLSAFPLNLDISNRKNVAGKLHYNRLDPTDYVSITIMHIIVFPEFTRQGLATDMYNQMIELGFRIFRSPTQTRLGRLLWQSFCRKGFVQNNEYIGISL